MDLESKAMVERLEAAASSLEKTLGWLEERQRFLSVEVERISATVESSRREEELASKLEAAERELAELKAAAGQDHPTRTVQTLRRTLPASTADMLAKRGIGLEGGQETVDVRTLDAALAGLSLEQRIAVKSQLRRAGAVA
jgi:predicted RNase H-like nuclease (RuvC/YqgF family)